MLPKIIVLLPLLAASLPAQQDPPAPRVNASKNSGLHDDGSGRLVGGGEYYAATFDTDGVRFLPALGTAAPSLQHLQLQPLHVRRGNDLVLQPVATAPRQHQLQVRYEHTPGIQERYDVGVDAMELSWLFNHRPIGNGDLTVRYAIDTTLPAPTATKDGGLSFAHADYGGITVGGVTGIDANGARIAGELQFVDGFLEMSLPRTFVDNATYPIVLDPLFGPQISVEVSSWPDAEPDAAYDASTGMYLVTFMRTFAGPVVWPRAQRVSASGALIGNTIFPSLNGTCRRARVADLGGRNRFGIVFEEIDGLFHGIRFLAIDAGSGNITHQSVVASTTGVDPFVSPDIAGTGSALPSSTDGFVIVYEDNLFDEIRARRFSIDAADVLTASSPVTVAADTGGIGNTYTRPAVSRCYGADKQLMIAMRRFSGIGPSVSVNVAVFRTDSMSVLASTSLGSSFSDVIDSADVDGFAGTYVVAWQRAASAVAAPGIRRRSVQYDSANGFTLGDALDLGGSTLFQASAPSVGYAPGRTWLGYRYFNGFGGSNYSLRAAAVDSQTATWCDAPLVEPITSADSRIVVATTTSGGFPQLEDGLATFAENGNIYAQRVRNYGTSGTTVSLGGGCGSGGVQFFNHEPGIGSSQLQCGVIGLSPSAVATVFNFATPSGSAACGPCVWTPFGITSVHVPAGGSWGVSFPIPCLPGLIGAQFETQWTTLVPGEVPCPILPDFVLSDRVLITLGN